MLCMTPSDLWQSQSKKSWKFEDMAKNMGGKGFQDHDLGEIRELVCTTPEELINSRWVDGDECFWTIACLPTTSSISFASATPERAKYTPPLPPPSQPTQREDKDKDLYDVHFCSMNSKQSPCCTVNKLTCCVYVCPHVKNLITVWQKLYKMFCVIIIIA